MLLLLLLLLLLGELRILDRACQFCLKWRDDKIVDDLNCVVRLRNLDECILGHDGRTTQVDPVLFAWLQDNQVVAGLRIWAARGDLAGGITDCADAELNRDGPASLFGQNGTLHDDNCLRELGNRRTSRGCDAEHDEESDCEMVASFHACHLRK